MLTDQLIAFITEHYFSIIVLLFVLFVTVEMIIPVSKNHESLSFRWFTNFSMTIFIIMIFELTTPLLTLLTALAADYFEFGLLNYISMSSALSLLVGIVILDLKQYLFHRLMHYFDFLWYVHQIHHSDTEIDLTTGFRFHPIEAILSALVDIVLIVILGITVEVLIFRYVLIFFSNFFTHGNIYLPPRMDKYLQWVFVTPSMHHLHHAINKRASNSNFGVLLSTWDHLFGTYLNEYPEPTTKEDSFGFEYGLRDYRDPDKLNLVLLMIMPFKNPVNQQEKHNL